MLMTDDHTTFDLKKLRTRYSLTQQQMASAMGLPLRTYEDIEAGRTALRPVHINAARYGAWQARNPASVKGLPLAFFIVRFKNKDGVWSCPWSVWAVDFAQAIDRFYGLGTYDATGEIQIRHVETDQVAGVVHNADYADAVLEQRDMEWPA